LSRGAAPPGVRPLSDNLPAPEPFDESENKGGFRMVTKKAVGKKLKVKKETIKDLDVKVKASQVKGGYTCPTTMNHKVITK
jgi:hypothetical protein